MSEPKKKQDEAKPAATELPDTKHHYEDPVGSLTNPKPAPRKEAAKVELASVNDALGARAES